MTYDNEYIKNFITYLKCEIDMDDDLTIDDHWRFYTSHYKNNQDLRFNLLKIDYNILQMKYDFLLKNMDNTRNSLRKNLQRFI